MKSNILKERVVMIVSRPLYNHIEKFNYEKSITNEITLNSTSDIRVEFKYFKLNEDQVQIDEPIDMIIYQLEPKLFNYDFGLINKMINRYNSAVIKINGPKVFIKLIFDVYKNNKRSQFDCQVISDYKLIGNKMIYLSLKY